MDLASLFAAHQQRNASEAAALPSVRAGRATLQESTVTSDPRKGTLKFIKEEGILKLQWLTRPEGVVEDSITIAAGDVTVEIIPECTSGRVLLFTFAGESQRRFFWIQEPEDAEKDAATLSKIKTMLESLSSSEGSDQVDPSTTVTS